MDFRDSDGQPFPPWTDPESAFEAWKECTAGRPCDYTGLTYDKLRGGSGIQWPCNAEHPDGTERLYARREILVSERDARRLGIGEGDLVEVSTPRGCVVGAARICGIRDGVLFVPFHYGYWDTGGKVHHRAGNEMTLTDWDPVSKQPIYKTAAARLRKARAGQAERNGAGFAPTTAASAPVNGSVPATEGGALAGVTEVVAAGS
jgi:predicted molibdopterin-dependent oxidoreductase YjgC